MKSISSAPFAICFSVAYLFSIADSYPAGPVQSPNYAAAGKQYQKSDKDAQIISYIFDIDPEKLSFEYGFQTDNGLQTQARGYVKDVDSTGNGIQVIEGNFVVPDAEGKPSVITYTADENGYNPTGDAIPTPSPVIQKAVAYLKSLPPAPETYPQTYPAQYNPQYKPQPYKPHQYNVP